MNILSLRRILPIILGAAILWAPSLVQADLDSQGSTSAAVSGSNQLALDLYRQFDEAEPGTNLFFSPYSIASAFAMVDEGAGGETRAQMNRVLGFGQVDNLDEIHAGFSEINTALNAEDKLFELAVANRLWGEKTFAFQQGYLDALLQFYGAGLESMDFRTSPEDERQRINSWVEKQTKDRIKDLMPVGSVNVATRLVLTNAIYFKGVWKNTFDKRRTHEENFTQADGEKIKIPFMAGELPSKIGGFTSKGDPDAFTENGYLDPDGFSVLELPYAGDELAMVFILAHKVDGLPALERRLRAEQIPQWRRQLSSGQYHVLLPKMKLNTRYGLIGSMRALGMVDAFDAGKADLSGIAELDLERLYISAAVHKAFVEVNEEGTEAAAATGISISVTSAKPHPDPSFRADHPFLFMIIHKPTNAILFIGRYGRP